MIGGGEIQRDNPILKKCIELLKVNNTYFTENRDNMKYPRHGHSVCVIGSKFLVVSGSRIDDEQKSHSKVEQYNIDMDIWFDLPDLQKGRHYHSSCAFQERFIYVFFGIL